MIMNYKYLDCDTTSYPQSLVTLHGQAVENVRVFCYLGGEIKFDEPGTGDTEVDLRVSLAESKFYELSKKLLNHKILLSPRIHILNSMVRSRLTYSCQTWTLTKRQNEKIESTYASMLRKMVKGGYRRKEETDFHYVLSNDDLHKICHTENIETFVGRQQKKYLAHIARKPNLSMVKRLLFNDNKHTKPGRQTTLENVVLEKEQCTAEEFYRRALDRKC